MSSWGTVYLVHRDGVFRCAIPATKAAARAYVVSNVPARYQVGGEWTTEGGVLTYTDFQGARLTFTRDKR